jgi:hypothetical protein
VRRGPWCGRHAACCGGAEHDGQRARAAGACGGVAVAGWQWAYEKEQINAVRMVPNTVWQWQWLGWQWGGWISAIHFDLRGKFYILTFCTYSHVPIPNKHANSVIVQVGSSSLFLRFFFFFFFLLPCFNFYNFYSFLPCFNFYNFVDFFLRVFFFFLFKSI